MKKLLLLVFIVLFSCSKDAGVETPSPVQVVTKYNLSVESSEGGSVDTSGGSYNANAQVTITATASEGYIFSEWTGNASGNTNPLTLTMNGNKTITANFIKSKYDLNLLTKGEGTVTQEIINTARTPTEYDAGTTVGLTATPAEGWLFYNWLISENANSSITEGNTISTDNPLSISMDKSKTVTATFEKVVDLSSQPNAVVGKWKIRKKNTERIAECFFNEFTFNSNLTFSFYTGTETTTGIYSLESNNTILLTQKNQTIGIMSSIIITDSFISFSIDLTGSCEDNIEADQDENYTPSPYTYIPDDNFEQALIDLGYDDVLDDYVLTTNIKDLDGQLAVYDKGVSDLTGVEAFQSITELYIINKLGE